METQSGHAYRQVDVPFTNGEQPPLRVNPNYSLPSSLPPPPSMDRSPVDGMARTASRKRRPTGRGSGKPPIQHFSQPPAAPEVPKAPPISYRPPQGSSENYNRRGNGYPPSFAQRAAIINSRNAQPDAHDGELINQLPKRERRASLNRPIGGVYTEIQQQKRDSIHSPSDAASPRRASLPVSAHQTQTRSNPRDVPPESRNSAPVRSDSRRISTSVVEQPGNDWAYDRSPLQNLEVKFSDISKEERRARVQKAEQRLRESKLATPGEYRKPDLSRDRNDSRRASTGTGAADKKRLSEQIAQRRDSSAPQTTTDATAGTPRNARFEDRSHQQQSERQQRPSEIAARWQEPRGAPPVGLANPVSQEHSRETSVTSAEHSRGKPSERGVRFRGEPNSEEGASRINAVSSPQRALYESKTKPNMPGTSAATFGGYSDPVPEDAVIGPGKASKYELPPQTYAGIQARQAVGFSSGRQEDTEVPAQRRRHLSDILHHPHGHTPNAAEAIGPRPRILDEWRHSGTARLTAADFVDEPDQNAWWEKKGSSGRRRSQRGPSSAGSEGQQRPTDGYASPVASFSPPLYLKCGPLLRYTGMRRDKLETNPRAGLASTEPEVWRGSVMIVTTDADSTYDPVPTLRLFPEPMELLPPPPPQKVDAEDSRELPEHYVDPIAGLPKLSRTGTIVYVKPVDDLEAGKDLSGVENDDGLFEETRTAAVPTAYGTPEYRHGQNGPQLRKSQIERKDGFNQKRGHRVRGVRIHAERGVTFWRFNLEVELAAQENRIAYSINNGPAVGFWVPAKGQTMNMMFHSCNGFSASVDPNHFSGPDPLWRDVLNSHQTRPFHVMIGGGDQIYNDAIMTQSPLFKEWLEIKDPRKKHGTAFSSAMVEEMEEFYLKRYSMWFSQGLFGMANSQIPMVNMWDDHDIIDGFGSYPHHFMSTAVFCGLGAIAFKYYMLFQHQSVPSETSADEPSWLLGAAPGPYINELSRSVFVSLGKNVAFVGLDCRTERMREEVLSEASYELVFERCRRELVEGETKHLIVLLGVPIAYPRLVWLENLLTSRVMDPIKALGRAGMLGGFLNKFDGGVEILDDLDDHWTARNHKQERNWFVQKLQEFAAEKSARVTILGGDVHLAAVGRFYSNPKLNIPKDRDHRYMANIISSAIVNTPPPELMGDILNKRNKIHHLDHETEEDMIPMFSHDVDGKARKNKRLLPRRNWCCIREYQSGATLPSTPPESEPATPSDVTPPPPNALKRTLSLTRNEMRPGNLLRRLSGRAPPAEEYMPSNEYESDESPLESSSTDGHFRRQPPMNQSPPDSTLQRQSSAPFSRPGNFLRRQTNMSERAVTRGNDDDTADHLDLEHSLDIVLNCEANQNDPAGITIPYRLLIPALFYEGEGDENTIPIRKKSVLSRLNTLKTRRSASLAGAQGQGNWGNDDESFSGEENEPENPEGARPRQWSFGPFQRRQYRDQTPPQTPSQIRRFQEQPSQQDEEEEQKALAPSEPQPPRQRQPAQRQKRASISAKQANAYDDESDVQRRSSLDYHEHLDATREHKGNGFAGRRLSKAERMLGVEDERDGPVTRDAGFPRREKLGNGGGHSYGAPHEDMYDGADDDDHALDEDHPSPASAKRESRGYSGIEAYNEKKGWRKWF